MHGTTPRVPPLWSTTTLLTGRQEQSPNGASSVILLARDESPVPVAAVHTVPKLSPSRRAAPQLPPRVTSGPFVATWPEPQQRTTVRRAPAVANPRLAVLLATLGSLLLSFVAPLS